jgi:acyl-coenzyme A thioesterase PaaI-like protein
MELHVVKKQQNARMCFVCGLKNAFGLQSRFYELENDELLAMFTPKQEHQGYPGRLHGGLAAAILDETIGRAIMIRHTDDIWGVTIEFSARYRKPVPLDEETRIIARITSDGKRIFEGSGEIVLADGSIAIEGKGKYLRMPIDKIADFDHESDEWRQLLEENDPVMVTLPDPGKS